MPEQTQTRKVYLKKPPNLTPAPEFMRTGKTPCRWPTTRDLFLHGFNGRKGAKLDAQAQEVCRTCPFRADCARWAMDNPEVKGVYGGTTDVTRALARKRAAVAA